MKKRLLAVLIPLAFLLTVTVSAFAMSSSSYSLNWQTLAGGGGLRSSPNYTLGDTGGQYSVIGISGSASYHLNAGFWNNGLVAAAVPGVGAPLFWNTLSNGGGKRISVNFILGDTSGQSSATGNSLSAHYQVQAGFWAFLHPAYQAPLAQDQALLIAEGQSPAITLTATGTGTLTYSVVANPAYGTLSGNPPAVVYTPASHYYYGPDSFTFKANDGQADSNTATVKIIIASNSPHHNLNLIPQNGLVQANGGQLLLRSDSSVSGSLSFQPGNWIIYLTSGEDWNNKCSIEIGSWNAANGFVAFTNTKQIDPYISGQEILTLNSPNELSLTNGNYLAVRITNNDGTDHQVITGGSSYLTAPEGTAPAPVPEMAAGVLLALGLAGLGAFILIRRQKARIKVVA